MLPSWDVATRSAHTMAQAWVDTILDVPDEKLLGHFSYSNTRGEAMSQESTPALMHVFNHGVHHRGQLSVSVQKHTGVYPVLDLLYFLSSDA